MHTTATRHTLDLDLSLHDIPLHLLQNVFTLLKSKPDLLGCDSTSATIEFCDLLRGESFVSEVPETGAITLQKQISHETTDKVR